MADDKHYVGGDFYRVCDRTGFKIRAGRTRKEWNDLIVRDQSFEPRQPQDFVRGVRDYQAVPDPRPRQVNHFIGPLETSVTAFAPAGTVSLLVKSTTRMRDGDSLSIILDDQMGTFFTTILHISSLTNLVINDKLPWSVSPGGLVVDTSAVSNSGTP